MEARENRDFESLLSLYPYCLKFTSKVEIFNQGYSVRGLIPKACEKWSTRATHSHDLQWSLFSHICPSVHLSVPTFQNRLKQNNFPVKIVIATGQTGGSGRGDHRRHTLSCSFDFWMAKKKKKKTCSIFTSFSCNQLLTLRIWHFLSLFWQTNDQVENMSRAKHNVLFTSLWGKCLIIFAMLTEKTGVLQSYRWISNTHISTYEFILYLVCLIVLDCCQQFLNNLTKILILFNCFNNYLLHSVTSKNSIFLL